MQSETNSLWLSDADVALRYSLKSRITVWRWAKAGLIPKPRRIGPNTTRWYAPELDERDARVLDGTNG